MNGPEVKPVYQLAADEKAQSVMVYTTSGACWGEVIVKEIIRVSTWLRTNNASDRICLSNAKMMIFNGGAPKAIPYPELFITVPQIMAYHLIPPAQDPVDFDVNEPNRKMEPVTAVVGNFRMDGNIRISTISNLSRFLDVTHETFTSLYDVEVSNQMQPAMGAMKVPYVLIRQATTLFSNRCTKELN